MLRMALVCVKNGVPYDVAFALYPHELMAYCVMFGEMEGGTFSWSSLAWVRADP